MSIFAVGIVLVALVKSRHVFTRTFGNSSQSIEMEWRHVASDESEVEDEV